MGARTRLTIGAAVVMLFAAAGCGSDDDASVDTTGGDPTTTAAATGESATTTVADGPTTTAASPILRILVSNDDGVGAEGIDVLVEALRSLPDTEVTVIAPKDQQSGQGSKRTDGQLTVGDATTRSGFPATAVAGYPYDTIVYALEQGGLDERPHLVMTGINEGANVGPLVDISGTIGAARAAAQRGIPALASSQGLAADPAYEQGVEYALRWLAANREALLAGTLPPSVTSLNIPTCATGAIRGEVTVPTATDAGGRELVASNCASTLEDPADDVDGFGNGFATFSTVPTGP